MTESEPTPLPAAKVECRVGLLASRRRIVAGRDRAADAVILADLVVAAATGLGVTAGGTVAAYEALRSEPSLDEAIRRLEDAGVRVIVPVTLPDRDLDWCDHADVARAPLGREAIGGAKLVLVPALGVDRSGTRLGRGGGSYDRALPRRAVSVPALAVVHPGEIHGPGALPREPHDAGVDGVLTVDGLVRFSPSCPGRA